jgi:hypothetical protein
MSEQRPLPLGASTYDKNTEGKVVRIRVLQARDGGDREVRRVRRKKKRGGIIWDGVVMRER